ncbi:MAG: c-type cytochrome [Pyrinomonadaceae bacterium]
MMTKALFLTLALALFIIGCGQPAANTGSNNAAANTNKPVAATTPANTSTPEVAKATSGKDLYTVNCMTCHKDSGKGGKVTVEGRTMEPDDLTDAKMKAKSDDKLYGYIADGIEDEGMPAFKDKLKPDEIKAVVAHLRDLQK